MRAYPLRRTRPPHRRGLCPRPTDAGRLGETESSSVWLCEIAAIPPILMPCSHPTSPRRPSLGHPAKVHGDSPSAQSIASIETKNTAKNHGTDLKFLQCLPM